MLQLSARRALAPAGMRYFPEWLPLPTSSVRISRSRPAWISYLVSVLIDTRDKYNFKFDKSQCLSP